MTCQLENQSSILNQKLWLTIPEFTRLIRSSDEITISDSASVRLEETRKFIDYLLANEIKVYGLTTGFADLRDKTVPAELAGLLSINLIRSHDAGIGEFFPDQVTLGAMLLRAHSLSKGYSGFTSDSIQTLIGMVNARIIPLIPSIGSLGASGDLACLARLGRAMMGDDVPVNMMGERMSAREAMRRTGIPLFRPQAKEGLALTNGTPFMASMLAIAYEKEIENLQNLLSLTGLFLNAVEAIDMAYYASSHTVRQQNEQATLAESLKAYLTDSDMIDRNGVQNDYSIRCLPQIYGPRFGLILEQKDKVERELNAITDNPLIFRDHEISPDVEPHRIISANNQLWTVISGGNFHGENLTAIADLIALSNAKIALTIERQMTYLMNPFRNRGKLPTYLISNEKDSGLRSGFMITQYSANAIAHQICLLAQPAGLHNMTSANESEDVVSYGAASCHKLLKQVDLFQQLLAIFLLASAQAYALKRRTAKKRNLKVEAIFEKIQAKIPLPLEQDEGFGEKYEIAVSLLSSKLYEPSDML